MIHYIIEIRHQLPKKDGSGTFEMISYFQRLTTVVFPMISLTGKQDEAKKFDCKSEALRTIKRLFAHKKENAKAIKITTP